ncbi:MAG: AAA family ATPase [Candidatus Omnitrophica bacterium]|nr:AAA family ATPase [Candidatus Omnitrophota bacterium]
MYEKYWKLKEKPFENTPDPKFIYYSDQHREGLSRLLYAVREQKGAGVLTGVFGCGKTLLGRTLLKELSREVYKTAFIANPKLEYVELLMTIASRLGAKELPKKRTEVLTNVVLDALSEILENNARDGKKTVLIIDEAHVIEDKNVWEELRLLLNFQTERNFLINVLFLGQPELKDAIERNRQLSQRIAIHCHLCQLSEEDTTKYIKHRFKVAGGDEGVFADSAIHLIYEYSGGIPRRINHLCDLALLTAFSHKVRNIEGEMVKEAFSDLEVE